LSFEQVFVDGFNIFPVHLHQYCSFWYI